MDPFENADKMQKKIAMSFMDIAKTKRKKKISVSEIMKPIHVTRQSFYYYFSDVDELIDWINVQTLEIPFSIFRKTKDLAKANEIALKIYLEDRDFFRNVISFIGKETFEASIYNKFLEGMTEHIGTTRLSGDEEFSAQVYLRGIVFTYLDIIENNSNINPKEVSIRLCKALPQNLIKYYDFEQFEVTPKKGRFWN